jgi:hypothetical protein
MTSLLFIPVASATIVGTLNTISCPNGGVTVTGTTIDFFPALGAGAGCIGASASGGPPFAAPLTYGTGIAFLGDTAGSISDLTLGGPSIVPDFMVFTSAGTSDTLHFDLTSLGPGVANTDCTRTDIACSVVAGSPFILQDNAGGVSITLPVFGLAHDSVGGPSDLSSFGGAFTTQIALPATAASIATEILSGSGSFGTGGSTVSGQFTITAGAPEPVSMALIGGGLIGLALLRKRRRRV